MDKQAGAWNVGPSNFFSLTDKVIIFEPGVVLAALPGQFPGIYDRLLGFINCTNLTIIAYGAELRMNRAEYAALGDSEYRHSFYLFNCAGISLRGGTLRESGGDGIYIGGETGNGSGYCQDITIRDVRCIDHYRQGMSVTSVENLTVSNCLFTGTEGTLPEAGLDIEPYLTYQRVINANFINCSFTNNGWSGIAVALFEMDDSSPDVSITFTDCYMRDNCRPGNTYAKSEIHLSADKVAPVGGSVLFEQCFVDGSDYGAFYSRKTADAYFCTFRDCVFQDVSRLAIQYNEPIFMEVPDYDNPSDYLGGYLFDNVLVSYATDFAFFRVFGWSTLAGIKDIAGNFTVVEPNDNGVAYSDVPEEVDVTYTFTNQSSLPATTVDWSATATGVTECAGPTVGLSASRSGTDLSYPLGIRYDTSGTANYADDLTLLTTGLIIPGGSAIAATTLTARPDGIVEAPETAVLELLNGPFYATTAAPITIMIEDCAAVLPVTWLSFTAAATERGNRLRWSTAEEVNNAYFEVQRAGPDRRFAPLARVAAGTGEGINDYDYLDAPPPAGLAYYRLRQVDYDGTYDYSPLVQVHPSAPGAAIVAYPNPTTGRLYLATDREMPTTVTLLNSLGQVVKRATVADSGEVSLAGLATGSYVLVFAGWEERVWVVVE